MPIEVQQVALLNLCCPEQDSRLLQMKKYSVAHGSPFLVIVLLRSRVELSGMVVWEWRELGKRMLALLLAKLA